MYFLVFFEWILQYYFNSGEIWNCVQLHSLNFIAIFWKYKIQLLFLGKFLRLGVPREIVSRATLGTRAIGSPPLHYTILYNLYRYISYFRHLLELQPALSLSAWISSEYFNNLSWNVQGFLKRCKIVNHRNDLIKIICIGVNNIIILHFFNSMYTSSIFIPTGVLGLYLVKSM